MLHLDTGLISLSTNRMSRDYDPFFCNSILQYVQANKEQDNDWFRLESNKEGTRWFGKCWYIHELLKYEFDVEFDVSCVDASILYQLCSVQSSDNRSVISYTLRPYY